MNEFVEVWLSIVFVVLCVSEAAFAIFLFIVAKGQWVRHTNRETDLTSVILLEPTLAGDIDRSASCSSQSQWSADTVRGSHSLALASSWLAAWLINAVCLNGIALDTITPIYAIQMSLYIIGCFGLVLVGLCMTKVSRRDYNPVFCFTPKNTTTAIFHVFGALTWVALPCIGTFVYALNMHLVGWIVASSIMFFIDIIFVVSQVLSKWYQYEGSNGIYYLIEDVVMFFSTVMYIAFQIHLYTIR